jgi:hypothetical protein
MTPYDEVSGDDPETDNDDMDVVGDELVTLRIYPATIELFCNALQVYADKCEKSQKAATRAIAEDALRWIDRLRDAHGELCEQDVKDLEGE